MTAPYLANVAGNPNISEDLLQRRVEVVRVKAAENKEPLTGVDDLGQLCQVLAQSWDDEGPGGDGFWVGVAIGLF